MSCMFLLMSISHSGLSDIISGEPKLGFIEEWNFCLDLTTILLLLKIFSFCSIFTLLDISEVYAAFTAST